MKIFIVTAVLGLATLATSQWDSFWAQFKESSVVTMDCGRHWRFFGIDEKTPVSDGNPCYIREIFPKEPIWNGDIGFIGQLGPNVEMNFDISYRYEIVNPVMYLEKVSDYADFVSTRSFYPDSESVWESAKGLIIDEVVHEVAGSPEVLQANGIGDVTQIGLSDRIIKKANPILYVWGIRIVEVSV